MPKLRVIIKPPPEPQGDAEQQTEALRDYLLQMSEELAYVLTHLEADNINDSTFERIQSMIPRPYTGLPVMDGDASSGQSEQWARGDHRHGHDSTKADVTALETETAAREAHEADTGNPHEVTKSQVGLGNVANERQYSAQNPPPIPTPGEVGAIPATEKGSAGGVAELDANGMVPSAQLPSYVDDVLEYASLSDFPVTGESGKIYVALDTNRTYRWSGSAYVEISESLALGETSSTAYRGDRGKTAYDHSQVTNGNPHNVTATEVGLGNVDNVQQYSASNPPPYPVTSVNGSTGAVSLDAADVGARADDWVPDSEDIPYDNTTSGLMATDVQAAIDEIAQGGGGGGTAASAVSYDNTGSGLTATNVQDAIDEVYGDIPSQASDIGAQPTITASGILMGDGLGGVSAATAGTDYALPARPKKYLFVGDSYSVLSSNWVDFCAQYLGLSASQYVNAGVSGTGFIVDRNGNIGSGYNGFLDCIQAVTADRETYTDVVICGGINDAQYDTYQSFLGDHIKATITYIKSNFPNAMPHIGFIGGALETSSVLYGRTLPRRKIALYGYITAAIPYYLNGVENAIHQSAYCYGSDGLHPSATGSELIGMAVAQAIQNGAAEVYQANSLNLSYPSPWTITGEDITLNVHNDTAQLNINTASMVFNAGNNQHAQTYNRTTGLVMTLPSNLRVNRRYSVQCGIQLRNSNNTWTLVYGDWVLEGSTLTMFPVVLSGSGFQSVTTSLFSILSDVVFNLRTEDIN